jgi:hypothetical protein
VSAFVQEHKKNRRGDEHETEEEREEKKSISNINAVNEAGLNGKIEENQMLSITLEKFQGMLAMSYVE